MQQAETSSNIEDFMKEIIKKSAKITENQGSQFRTININPRKKDSMVLMKKLDKRKQF